MNRTINRFLAFILVLTFCFALSSSASAATTTEKWKTIRGQVDEDDAEAYFDGVGTATRNGSGYVRLRVRLRAISDSKYKERTLYGLCGTGYLKSFSIKGYVSLVGDINAKAGDYWPSKTTYKTAYGDYPFSFTKGIDYRFCISNDFYRDKVDLEGKYGICVSTTRG